MTDYDLILDGEGKKISIYDIYAMEDQLINGDDF